MSGLMVDGGRMTGKQTDRWMDVWTIEWMDPDEWTDRQMDDWTDGGRMTDRFHIYIKPVL